MAELKDFLRDVPDLAEVATLAGGCFWCIETAFDGREGVYEAISGYAGGDKNDASYRLVATGETAHKEAVQIYFDSEVISYEEILEIFWRQIDPTDDSGQFADRGSQYRTAIYFHDKAQEKIAKASKAKVAEMESFVNKEIVTEILPFDTFFPAEVEHQNFAAKRRTYYQQYKKGSGREGGIL